MSEIISPSEFVREPPASIKRPCDWGLESAVNNLEIQLGTIEAYNRLCAEAVRMFEKIASQNSVPPHPGYATRIHS